MWVLVQRLNCAAASTVSSLVTTEQEGSYRSGFWWRYINGGGYGGVRDLPPSSAFVIRGMWAELVTAHWAERGLSLMVMKSVDLHTVCEPDRLAPGGVFWSPRELKHPGRSRLCCCVLVHTHCRITSEPGLVNRSHVDSHVAYCEFSSLQILASRLSGDRSDSVFCNFNFTWWCFTIILRSSRSQEMCSSACSTLQLTLF